MFSVFRGSSASGGVRAAFARPLHSKLFLLTFALALGGCDSEVLSPLSSNDAALAPAPTSSESTSVSDPYARAGARTAFNRSNSLDLASYCNGGDDKDDTACIGKWLSDGQAQGKHLYASPGTYLYNVDRRLFNGVMIRCADPRTTIFKGVNGGSTTHNPKFILHSNFGGGPHPYSNVSIENCGFDLNGAQNNFANVITINGSSSSPATWARNITIRGNRFFDSTQPGQMYMDRSRQRQYIVVLAAQDVLIENNQLSEGGRIKAGRPGARIVIRGNRLHNINDNGITVVNTGTHTSSHFLIENNTVVNALGSGIFFGADGQAAGTAAQAISDIVIRNNRISGGQNACIQGTLPNHSRRVVVSGNTCEKVATQFSIPAEFDRGIAFIRASESTEPVRELTVRGNTITSQSGFGNGAIFAKGLHTGMCVLNNTFHTGTGSSIRLELGSAGTGKVASNVMNGSRLRVVSGTVDESGSTAGCFL